MLINEIVENDDGSCDMEVTFEEGEVKILLNYAVNEILRKQLEELKKDAA